MWQSRLTILSLKKNEITHLGISMHRLQLKWNRSDFCSNTMFLETELILWHWVFICNNPLAFLLSKFNLPNFQLSFIQAKKNIARFKPFKRFHFHLPFYGFFSHCCFSVFWAVFPPFFFNSIRAKLSNEYRLLKEKDFFPFIFHLPYHSIFFILFSPKPDLMETRPLWPVMCV